MIGTLFATMQARIAAGVIALLLTFAGIQTYRASHWRGEAQEARQEVGAVNERLKVSNASIDSLEAEFAFSMQLAAAHAAKLRDDEAAAKVEAERLSELAEVSQGRIDRLKAIAETVSSDCRVPESLTKELRGL